MGPRRLEFDRIGANLLKCFRNYFSAKMFFFAFDDKVLESSFFGWLKLPRRSYLKRRWCWSPGSLLWSISSPFSNQFVLISWLLWLHVSTYTRYSFVCFAENFYLTKQNESFVIPGEVPEITDKCWWNISSHSILSQFLLFIFCLMSLLLWSSE